MVNAVLELPTSGVEATPLVSLSFNATWKEILLAASAYLQTPLAWVEGTDYDDVETQLLILDELIANAEAAAPSMFVGTVFSYAGTATALSLGCLECDGTTYLRTAYPLLYAALPAVWIVDANNFKVPDLRGRVTVGNGQGAGLGLTHVVGVGGGVETVTLTVAQIPAHHHQQRLNTSTSGALSGEVDAVDTSSSNPIGAQDTGDTGGGGSHSNMPPYLPIRHLIVAL